MGRPRQQEVKWFGETTQLEDGGAGAGPGHCPVRDPSWRSEGPARGPNGGALDSWWGDSRNATGYLKNISSRSRVWLCQGTLLSPLSRAFSTVTTFTFASTVRLAENHAWGISSTLTDIQPRCSLWPCKSPSSRKQFFPPVPPIPGHKQEDWVGVQIQPRVRQPRLRDSSTSYLSH